MPVVTSIESYTTGRVPKQGIPMIQCYVHKHLDTNKYLISDSTGACTLVASKENHVQVIKAKVVYIIISKKIFYSSILRLF